MYVAFVDLKEEIYGVKGSCENIKPRTTMEFKLTDISNSEFYCYHPCSYTFEIGFFTFPLLDLIVVVQFVFLEVS